jgi:rRNA processing protein Krr1/Pno1
VKKALDAFQALIDAMTQNAFSMRVDDKMIRYVVGSGGKTIREITSSTGAVVEIRSGEIIIRGLQDQVEAARSMIEAIARRTEIRIDVEPHTLSLLTTKTNQPDQSNEHDEHGGRANDMSPLDMIRMATQCEQVQPLYREHAVVLRGKRECVQQARTMILDLARSNQLFHQSVKVPSPGFLKKLSRKEGKSSALDTVRLEHHGVVSIRPNRESCGIDIAGKKDAVAAAARRIEGMLQSLAGCVRNVRIPPAKSGAVIGKGGKIIHEIETQTKTEVTLDRQTGVVVLFHSDGDGSALDRAEQMLLEIVRVDRDP